MTQDIRQKTKAEYEANYIKRKKEVVKPFNKAVKRGAFRSSTYELFDTIRNASVEDTTIDGDN